MSCSSCMYVAVCVFSYKTQMLSACLSIITPKNEILLSSIVHCGWVLAVEMVMERFEVLVCCRIAKISSSTYRCQSLDLCWAILRAFF